MEVRRPDGGPGATRGRGCHRARECPLQLLSPDALPRPAWRLAAPTGAGPPGMGRVPASCARVDGGCEASCHQIRASGAQWPGPSSRWTPVQARPSSPFQGSFPARLGPLCGAEHGFYMSSSGSDLQTRLFLKQPRVTQSRQVSWPDGQAEQRCLGPPSCGRTSIGTWPGQAMRGSGTGPRGGRRPRTEGEALSEGRVQARGSSAKGAAEPDAVPKPGTGGGSRTRQNAGAGSRAGRATC